MAVAMPLSASEQIVARSDAVKRLGAYIGAFDLLVWSALEQVRVCLVIGGSAHDLRESFGLALPPLPATAPVQYFVACQVRQTSAGVRLMAVDTHSALPKFGHYVVGTPLSGHMHASIDPVSGEEHLRTVSLRLGFSIAETQMAGDCGIDVMCYHRGCARDSSTFKTVRSELTTFMREIAGVQAWQECFAACGESCMSPTVVSPKSAGGSKVASPKSAGGSKRTSSKSSGGGKKFRTLAAWFRKPYALGSGSGGAAPTKGKPAVKPKSPPAPPSPPPLPPLPPPSLSPLSDGAGGTGCELALPELPPSVPPPKPPSPPPSFWCWRRLVAFRRHRGSSETFRHPMVAGVARSRSCSYHQGLRYVRCCQGQMVGVTASCGSSCAGYVEAEASSGLEA